MTPHNESEVAALRRAIRRVHHDLRNPVAIISGNAQLLGEIASASDLPEDVRAAIQDVAQASDMLEARLKALDELGRADGR